MTTSDQAPNRVTRASRRAVRIDLKRRHSGWLANVAHTLAGAVHADFNDYREAHQAVAKRAPTG